MECECVSPNCKYFHVFAQYTVFEHLCSMTQSVDDNPCAQKKKQTKNQNRIFFQIRQMIGSLVQLRNFFRLSVLKIDCELGLLESGIHSNEKIYNFLLILQKNVISA